MRTAEKLLLNLSHQSYKIPLRWMTLKLHIHCQCVKHHLIRSPVLKINCCLSRSPAHRMVPPQTVVEIATITPIIIARFWDRNVCDDVIRQRRKLKKSKFTIEEDLTNLNVELMNWLRNSADVQNCWSWNGHIYALLKNTNKKVRVRPFQSIQKIIARLEVAN